LCRVSPDATWIKFPLDRTCHDRIDDGVRQATVRVTGWVATFGNGDLVEKDEFVHFANNDEGDGRVEV
jgi:hypothetical protein